MPTDELVLESTTFRIVGQTTLDERNRVALTKALERLKEIFASTVGFADAQPRLTFMIAVGSTGEILLTPSLPIPLRELWLHRNPEALASVLRGLEQAGKGQVHSLGSFSQHADEQLDDE